MAKISATKANRNECRERGPISRNTAKNGSPPRVPKGQMLTHCHVDYDPKVLAPDNIRILEKNILIKLDREDRSGQNMLKLYNEFKNRIIGRREQTTKIGALVATCHRFVRGHNKRKTPHNPDWEHVLDESLTSQESALEIDEYIFHSKLRVSARKRLAEKRKVSEQMFQKLLIGEVKIFQNLMLGQGGLQGLSDHRIHNEIGPEHVIANIQNHVKPDYLCGYSDPRSSFSIPSEIWDKVPRSLCVLTPQAEKSTECLFLPFLALELKWRGIPERIVINQLARCLSILAERQAALERISNSVSTTPIFGLTGVERNFTLWVMFRYESYSGEIRTHYDMCELGSYDLTSEDDVEAFRAAMANIHDWVENERKAHFTRCINSINQNPIIREVCRQFSKRVSRLARSWNLV
ncbi:hypothetical protein TWF506_003893 [Arthrobotrys conoides]|uniref:Uncharacterized protein n=1 Tax=Arthrobotrys conoides TaxID=74498 RepID=A0AAN8RPN9_9PEZI